ncbi:MAG: hypothetical protein EHM89_10745 [Acidobacteria bacterium]|nr:MAG: hypothetical protein EHM89_10745 [Acidobacteriota bacterium]
MSRIVLSVVAASMLFGWYGQASAQSNGGSNTASFSIAKVHLEQNATDGDFEVVLEVNSGGEGLEKLTVVSPDGRKVVDYSATGKPTMGMRHFHLETPEPNDIKIMRSGFPEGVYSLSGATPSGLKLSGKVTLTHKLPPAVTLLTPKPDAENVAIKNLRITWTPVKNVAGYLIYIEQPDANFEITARLPGSSTSFAVPEGLLSPGTAYSLGIGTVSSEGNTSFIETTFATAK